LQSQTSLEKSYRKIARIGSFHEMTSSTVKGKTDNEFGVQIPIGLIERLPLWQLDIVELTGHNLEARGREEVNRLLGAGWRLLHIYTLKYEEDGVWRERPMGILGRVRNEEQQDCTESGPFLKQSSLI
jgi:hypothetical protein